MLLEVVQYKRLPSVLRSPLLKLPKRIIIRRACQNKILYNTLPDSFPSEPEVRVWLRETILDPWQAPRREVGSGNNRCQGQ